MDYIFTGVFTFEMVIKVSPATLRFGSSPLVPVMGQAEVVTFLLPPLIAWAKSACAFACVGAKAHTVLRQACVRTG